MLQKIEYVAGMDIEDYPLQLGEHYELTIDRLGFGGMGVARHSSGLVCLVPKTLPGEVVIASVCQTKRRHAVLKLEEIRQASPLRQEPSCDYFVDCSGCHFQQLKYEDQLAAKHSSLLEDFTRQGEIDAKMINAVVPADPALHYRNKNFFHVEAGHFGFIDSVTKKLVALKQCPCAPATTNQFLQKLSQWLSRHDDGMLLDLLIRDSQSTQEMMFILVYDDAAIKQNLDFTELKTLLAPHALYVNYKPRHAKYSFGETMQHLSGPTHIHETIGDIKLKLSPGSFVQIHPSQAQQLYHKAKQLLELQGTEQHLDLYSGSGALAMTMARASKAVYAVELNRQACLDAQTSAVLNQIHNVEFRTGKCERIMERLQRSGFRAQTASLNPPRTGCDPQVLMQLKTIGVERFVYISCSPPTLKRDLMLLAKQGYRLKTVIPFDMFPQTYHLEVVALLQRQ